MHKGYVVFLISLFLALLHKGYVEFLIFLFFASTLFVTSPAHAAISKPIWRFAVAGDSRNCGDLVMPTIAASALKNKVQFYWHLGDFRWGASVDEDLAREYKRRGEELTLKKYRAEIEWKDFIHNQLGPFGGTPVFLSIGNHELLEHDRKEYVQTFNRWLNQPELSAQRKKDGLEGTQTYFHWKRNGVDFISVDNASEDQFDQDQLRWIEQVLNRDEIDPQINTVVLGMHEALPDSISKDHSMSDLGKGPIDTGRIVYHHLLRLRDIRHKMVYVLASHSHYYMEGTFNTEYWRKNGGVLPGWIIGTAGARRYDLPAAAKDAIRAETDVYGYLIATVKGDGSIVFDFKKLEKKDVPAATVAKYGAEEVDFCWDQNHAR